MLLLAPLLKRRGENLGKRQLGEDENDEGMGTGSAGKALDVAKRSPAFANFVLVLTRAVVGVPTAVDPTAGPLLGIPSVFLKFLLQLECQMCQQVTVCVSFVGTRSDRQNDARCHIRAAQLPRRAISQDG